MAQVEFALVLAEAMGRRLGSIRQLRWEDIDLAKPQIRWRAEADKKRKEWVIPIPAPLADELRTFQRRLGAVGGRVFAAELKPNQPMDRSLLNVYQQPDPHTLLAVMSEPRKVSEKLSAAQ